MFSLRGLSLESDERRWLASPATAGVILFARNFESLPQLRLLVADIRAARNPSPLVAVDQEGGRVQRFGEPFCKLPPMRRIGQLYDTDPEAALRSARSFAWLMAAELRACGIDLSFAPVVDLDRGLASVIGDRALHHSADAVSRLACAFLAGAKDAGMHVSAKHFPTHSGAVADSHLAVATDGRPYDELLEDLAPYRALIGHGLRSIMMAHVMFPDLDPEPASFSRWWIEQQLRSSLGFRGAVISDDISMVGAAGAGNHAQRAVAALDAGCDMVLLCNEPDAVAEAIAAVEGRASPASAHRLMRMRGEPAPDFDLLRGKSEWRAAVDVVDGLRDAPSFELEG